MSHVVSATRPYFFRKRGEENLQIGQAKDRIRRDRMFTMMPSTCFGTHFQVQGLIYAKQFVSYGRIVSIPYPTNLYILNRTIAIHPGDRHHSVTNGFVGTCNVNGELPRCCGITWGGY